MLLVYDFNCALVISVPLSFFGGIGGASKSGVLVKGSNYLEILANLKTIVFDKTGTLTENKMTVTTLDVAENELEMDEMLQNKLLKVLEDKRVFFESPYYDASDTGIPKYIRQLFEKGAPASTSRVMGLVQSLRS